MTAADDVRGILGNPVHDHLNIWSYPEDTKILWSWGCDCGAGHEGGYATMLGAWAGAGGHVLAIVDAQVEGRFKEAP